MAFVNNHTPIKSYDIIIYQCPTFHRGVVVAYVKSEYGWVIIPTENYVMKVLTHPYSNKISSKPGHWTIFTDGLAAVWWNVSANKYRKI